MRDLVVVWTDAKISYAGGDPFQCTFNFPGTKKGGDCCDEPSVIHGFTRGRNGVYSYNGEGRCKKHKAPRFRPPGAHA